MPAKVMLNVYDMAAQNQYTYWFGLGVFHAGVEVYGIEWAYGGHDHDSSGVFATNPRDAPGQVVFRESLCMGETSLSYVEVERLVQQLGLDFKGNKYHLLQRNCNHFADDLCRQLVGKEMPYWVNRLASTAVMLHCLLPPTWVPQLETPTGPAPERHGEGDTQGLIKHRQDHHGSERQDCYHDRLRLTPDSAGAAGGGGSSGGASESIHSPTASGVAAFS